MLPELHGLQEKVIFDSPTGLLLHDNKLQEDYPRHWHSAYEIIMPLHNSYTVICNDQVYLLEERDILFIFPGCLHSLKAPNEGERLILQANYNQIYHIQELDATLAPLAPVFHLTPSLNPKIHAEIYGLLLHMKEEATSSTPLHGPMMLSYFIQILVLLGRYLNPSTSKQKSSNTKEKEYAEQFIAICTYINEHCTEDLTLDFIASLSGFSKYHFTRLFKLFANVSFYKYLNQQRIHYAEKLLLDDQLTVTEIALRSGFGSLSSFIRMFNIIKGCSPTEFRNMYR